MKVPKTINLLSTVILAYILMFLTACGQQGDSPVTPSGATLSPGPNSNLSSGELLKKAVIIMRALQSYHFEFKGGVPSESLIMSLDMSMTGDMQFNGKGSRVSIKDNGSGVTRTNPDATTLVSEGMERLYTPGDRGYISFDGGKTWDKVQVDTPVDFLMSSFGLVWLTDTTFNVSEELLNKLSLKDGYPQTEPIDGVQTRHITADLGTLATPDPWQYYGTPLSFEGAKTMSFWVSTELTPTVRQMRIEGSNTVRQNKVGGAKSIAFSLDGKALASAHDDGMVRLWDLTKPENAPMKLQANRGSPLSVAFSPDGKTLALGLHSGGPPSEVLLWDMDNLDTAPLSIATNSAVSSVAFRPDGKMLGAGVGNGVYLWTPPYKGAQATVISYPFDNVVNSIAFSSDNHTLASGNLNAGVRLHDTQNPQSEPTVLLGEWVDEVAFSPDGHLLAATQGFQLERSVKIWDLRKADFDPTILPDEEAAGKTLAFSPDGKYLVTNGQDNTVQFWDLSKVNSSEPSTTTFSLTGSGGVSALRYSQDGRWLGIGDSNGDVRLYNPQQPQSAPIVLKEDEKSTDTPYTLTWKWSRFNDDFGEVKPPPPETLKSP